MTAMPRRRFLLGFGALALGRGAAAQPPPARPSAVGVLEYGTAATFERQLAAFEAGLRDEGFVRGANLTIEARYADDDPLKLGRLAMEIVRANAQVIYAPAAWSVHAMIATGTRIPIVFSAVNDPVALKFVKSLARPGGTITGVTLASHELTAKRVQLIREVFPSATRVGVIYDEDIAKACQIEIEDIAVAGRRLGIEVRRFPYLTQASLASAFGDVQRTRVAALLVPTTMETRRVGKELVEHSTSAHVPIVHSGSGPIEAGGLLSYGPPPGWAERRAGQYAGRILRGARPGDMPIETPTTYELVINLKTARALGVTIPEALLMRATRIIE